MANLTTNNLKTKGVAAIEAVLAERPEAIVSVRGKDRFMVMAHVGVTLSGSLPVTPSLVTSWGAKQGATTEAS